MQTSSSSEPPAPSLLSPIGYQSGDCGYCKAEDSSQRTPDSRASYYVRAKALSPAHYQELMDRGWRRSGSLLYIPDAVRSCCPHYTIRLPASEFKATRDQRQALNRWNRHVLGDQYDKESSVKFPRSKEEKKRLNNTFDLVATVHESEVSNLKPGIEPKNCFEVTLEPDTFTEEKFALFDNYQRYVHHEGDGDISKGGFRRFLCSSPVERRLDETGKQLGSFHQCYRLNGRLIALSVVDLLPYAVSGVYFIYHNDFERWSFGKLSALRETALALENGYRFYYMGYYIHNCKKMRYKGDYKPQYVLDLGSMNWDPLDEEMRSLMDRQKYVSMSKERSRKQSRESRALTDASEKINGMNDDDNDAGEDVLLHPSPLAAANSNLSLLQLRMPGVMLPDDLRQQVNLDRMNIRIRGAVYEMQNIQSWASGSMLDHRTLKGVFAEFAAAVGPLIARDAVIDFN